MTGEELLDLIERTVRDRIKVVEREMYVCEMNGNETAFAFREGERAAYWHVLEELLMNKAKTMAQRMSRE